MDFITSYALRARSFSSFDTGLGLEMSVSNLSASWPIKTGVSLIGRAIIEMFVCMSTKIQQNYETFDIPIEISGLEYEIYIKAHSTKFR